MLTELLATIKEVLNIAYKDTYLGYNGYFNKILKLWYIRHLTRHLREYIRYYPKYLVY